MEKSIYKKAFCEVLYIIENMENEYIEKVPKKLLGFFKRHKDMYYKVNLSVEVPLESQKLLDETKAILAILCRKYWCDKEENRTF